MIMKLNPIFKETVWGGKKLATKFNIPIPSEHTGEVWGISGLKNDSNIILNGLYKGQTLFDLWHNERHLFGDKPDDFFPILIKIIDAKKDLSIQVHPNDDQAKKLGSLGKTECWTILDCEEDTDIIIGHNAESLEALRLAVNNKNVLDIVNHHPINPGDFFFIDSGTLHAIKGGTLLLEVQQSSNITYRFYDYDRLENGKLRPLHVEEALSVVKVPDKEVKTELDKRYFNLEFIRGESIERTAHHHGDFITVLEGEGFIGEEPVQKGMFLFVPSRYNYTITNNLELAIATIV